VSIPEQGFAIPLPSITLQKYGFKLKIPAIPTVPQRPKCNKRGAITGMSWKASARLRLFAIEHEVPGSTMWSFTGTTQRICSPEEWRTIMSRFKTLITRAGFGAIWRVELQRRKAPHVHAVIYAPSVLIRRMEDVPGEIIKGFWHRAIEVEKSSFSEQKYSANYQLCDDPEWIVYLAGHASKHKESQLGWLGKQWGIWNRSLFVSRLPLFASEMTVGASWLFWRTYQRYTFAKLRAKGYRSKMRAGLVGERVRCLDGSQWVRVAHWAMKERPQ